MNWQAVSGISEIVSAVVVVISLLYVAVQIRQNTKATRYQATQNLISAMSDAHFRISENGELAALCRKGQFNRGALNEDEQMRFNMWLFSTFNQYDFAYHQYLAGELDEKIWKKMEYELPLWIGSLAGVGAWWQQDKVRMSKDFADYVDSKLANSVPLSPHSLPTVNPDEKSG